MQVPMDMMGGHMAGLAGTTLGGGLQPNPAQLMPSMYPYSFFPMNGGNIMSGMGGMSGNVASMMAASGAMTGGSMSQLMRSASASTIQPVSESLSHAVTQSISQPVTRATSQPVNQSINHFLVPRPRSPIHHLTLTLTLTLALTLTLTITLDSNCHHDGLFHQPCCNLSLNYLTRSEVR